MERPAPLSEQDVLSAPVRARLFAALAELRRPATTDELAALVGRHPNTVRVQLRRLEAAGLVDCRRRQSARGRPRHTWAVRPDARPGGAPPDAHANLSRWLARALRGARPRLPAVEAAGRAIGAELAPPALAAGTREAMQDALAALGFAPRGEPSATGNRYVLGNCPYREAVAENPRVVCALHRGITQGLLERLQPGAALVSFVPHDPYAAGCVIEVAGA